jgi:nucleotide-binding universal stress UspA family protein
VFKRILIAHDGSDRAHAAFDAAVKLALELNAKLHMVSVEEDVPRYAENVDEVREAKEESDSYFGRLALHCRQRALLKGLEMETTTLVGHAVKSIVEFAREQRFDLLVVGFAGHSSIYEHVWGGTSHNLARLAPCSVLLVK